MGVRRKVQKMSYSNLSKTELAEAIGKSVKTVSRYAEQGMPCNQDNTFTLPDVIDWISKRDRRTTPKTEEVDMLKAFQPNNTPAAIEGEIDMLKKRINGLEKIKADMREKRNAYLFTLQEELLKKFGSEKGARYYSVLKDISDEDRNLIAVYTQFVTFNEKQRDRAERLLEEFFGEEECDDIFIRTSAIAQRIAWDRLKEKNMKQTMIQMHEFMVQEGHIPPDHPFDVDKLFNELYPNGEGLSFKEMMQDQIEKLSSERELSPEEILAGQIVISTEQN